MAGVRTLADGREKWIIMTEKPADPQAVTLAELTAGVNLGDRATRSGTYLRATASDTVADRPFNALNNSQALGASNYEGQIEPYLLLDPATGKPDAVDNEVYELVDTKGTTLWVWKRKGPLESVAPAASDNYELAEVVADEMQEPSDQSGNLRAVVPLIVRTMVKGTVAPGI